MTGTTIILRSGETGRESRSVTEKRARGARTRAVAGWRRGAAGVILACLLAACGAPSRAPGSHRTGGRAGSGANVEFADLDRIHAVLAGYRDRPVFVNFWATWCVPCVDELPDLAALSREDAVKGAGFIGVSLDAWVTGNGNETESKVRRTLAQAGGSRPQAGWGRRPSRKFGGQSRRLPGRIGRPRTLRLRNRRAAVRRRPDRQRPRLRPHPDARPQRAARPVVVT